MANIVEETLASSLDAVSATFVSSSGGVNSVTVWGTYVGTVVLEKSFDGGTVWHIQNEFPDTDTVRTITIREVEYNVDYRFRFAVYTSGDPDVRIAAGNNF